MTPTPKAHSFLNHPWWAMGQRVPGFVTRRVNETATRARAGLLNVLSATTIVVLLFKPDLDPVLFVGPFVIFDMFVAAAFGLTPFSPMGILGSLLTMAIRPAWRPTAPKRFAWILGGSLGVACLSMRLLHVATPWIIGVVAVCFVLTWLETALGFCVGCWIYGRFRECEECELPYARE